MLTSRITMSRMSIPFAALIVAVFAADAGAQNNTELSPDSNGGGTAFTLSCGRDNVLIGIKGGAGFFVDRIQGLCTQVNNAGQWVGNVFPTSASAGGNSGSPYELKCPQGSAVGGVRGKSGQWLDRIEILCRDISSSGKTIGSFAASPLLKAGSDAANNWALIACPEVQPANAIRGTAGGYVERVGLSCGQAQVITGLTLTPNPTGGGGGFAGTVTLSKVAQISPIAVSIASGNANATLSSPTIVIPPNAAQMAFAGGTLAVTTSVNAPITAQLREDKLQRFLRIDPPVLEALSLSPQTGTTGFTSSGTVRLVNAMPAATTVNLRSANTGIVLVPNSVQITGGQESSSAFQVTTVPNTTGGCVSVTASLPTGSQKSVMMVVRPVPTPSGAPVTIVIPDVPFGATSVMGQIRLARPAPREGLSVTLTASNSGVTVPLFVVVPRDQVMAAFSVRLNGAIGCTTVSGSAANSVSRVLVQWNNVGG
jgi:hypothetical protein